MKKLVPFAIAAMLSASVNASTINWFSSDAPQGVQLSSLNGNGTVSANGALLSGAGIFNYTLTIYSSDWQTTLGSASGAMAYDDVDDIISVYNIDPGVSFVQDTAYAYKAVISGKQTDMASYADANWDYSNASLASEITGTFTGKQGDIDLNTGVPASWTVSGAEAVPEPFSGALALVGLGVIGLRRKLKGKKQEKMA